MNDRKSSPGTPRTPRIEATVPFVRLPTSTQPGDLPVQDLYVSPTPQGWIVLTRKGGLAYVPDRGHKWGVQSPKEASS